MCLRKTCYKIITASLVIQTRNASMYTKMTMTTNIILILLALSLLSVASACRIHGTDSGVCTYKYTTSSQATLEQIESAKKRYENDMPFCGKYVHYYPACVPAASSSRSYDESIPNFLVNSDDNADVTSIRGMSLKEYCRFTLCSKTHIPFHALQKKINGLRRQFWKPSPRGLNKKGPSVRVIITFVIRIVKMHMRHFRAG